MNNNIFKKLAADNIKRNNKSYIPYILSCIVTVAVFYIMKSLSLNPGLKTMIGADTISALMYLGSIVVALFALVFLLYANSFLVKRRKKEWGVFNIFGMERRHIAKTLAWEMFYVFIISLSAGLIFGIALDKVMFLLIIKVIGGTITLGFFVSVQTILVTAVLFAVIFIVIYIHSLCRIHIANPIDLLRGGAVGEKEPKANVALAVLGILLIGSGYGISIIMDKPISRAVPYLFCAVLAVIVGTYLFFAAGTIVFLKMLRKRKNYYYKLKHFISVSNLIYRMKQNAVGLANICILSTMSLVMVSSTGALIFGLDDIILTQYPNDFDVYLDETDWARREESIDCIRRLQNDRNLNVTAEVYYAYIIIPAADHGEFFVPAPAEAISGKEGGANFIFVTLSDYNTVMGTNKTLGANEVLVYSNRKAFGNDTFKIFDREYYVKEDSGKPMGNGVIASDELNSYMVVVPNMEEMNQLYELQKKKLGDLAANICCFYGFDTDADETVQEEFYDALTDTFTDYEYQGTVESKADAKSEQVGMYGGFFFIGAFLGTLFLAAMVLIIYYKQISEGNDDRERFAIMQKVGMSKQEVRASIRSQVQTVFFLPLVIAGVHVIAAFPMISKLLLKLNLRNTGLYIGCTTVSFLIFATIYTIIYHLTARIYYGIVNR